MIEHDSFATLPARMIRLYGALAERQIRLMTEVTRMALLPNPLLLAFAGLEWDRPAPQPPAPPRRPRAAAKPRAARLEVVTAAPEPAAAPKASSDVSRKRARRRPSKPPAMPERQS
ncbi:hypothetical protein [Pseudooceanicola sp.]|uniref:hypothetical protein n=1 Tax=Pseudooceanicola sp. TaxID=1914328 RepID=UPI004058766E